MSWDHFSAVSALKSSLTCQAVLSPVMTLLCHAEKEDAAVPSRCSRADWSSVTLQPPHLSLLRSTAAGFCHPVTSQSHTPVDLHTNGGGLTHGLGVLCLTQHQTRTALQWQLPALTDFFPSSCHHVPCHLWTMNSEDKLGNEGSQGLQMPNEATQPLIISVISFLGKKTKQMRDHAAHSKALSSQNRVLKLNTYSYVSP